MQILKKQIVLVGLLLGSCTTTQLHVPDLKIGKPGLEQKVTSKKLHSGVQYIEVARGHRSSTDYCSVSSGIISKENAEALVNKLTDLGFSPRIEYSPERDPHGDSLGVIVRTGKFENEKDVIKLAKELKEKGILMAPRYTAEDGHPTTGPFQISLLEIDLNKYTGNMSAALAKNQIDGKATTSAIAKANKAFAAVNAGFFAWKKAVGTPGDPAGISVIDGKLVSEAINGRPALVIDNTTPKKVWIAHNVETHISMQLADTTWQVNGINRTVGKVLNCGNRNGNTTEIPTHDFLCENKNELIIFTPDFGSTATTGNGIEIAINNKNEITSITTKTGGAIPKEGFLIQATGTQATTLQKYVKIGAKIQLNTKITSNEGPITLKKGIYLINGGPTLLRNGKMVIADRFKEGWETQFNRKISDDFIDKKDKTSLQKNSSNNRAAFYHGWVVRRHPRTALGITKDNKLYIAVVYGRQPGVSSGASITEMSLILQSLGATEAINLDGGGSSVMVIDGQKTGIPSDKTGERAVGDALLFSAQSEIPKK